MISGWIGEGTFIWTGEFLNYGSNCMISNILRNLRDLLEEAHTHTMLNPRAAAIFQVLCQPNEKLGIMFISLTSY